MPAARIVSTAPMGSTMPDSTPSQNARRFGIPFCPQGHGDDGPLWEVLDGDPKGKCQRSGCSDLSSPGKIASIDHPHRHALRDVVQRHCQNHHSGALELAFWPFGLQTILVQMRNKMIQQQQKQDAQPEAHRCREKTPACPGLQPAPWLGSADSILMPPPSLRLQSR